MLLSVGILTYNQVAFIGQCLDSVLIQNVNFDYEIVVGDDCSTDGTQDVLRRYQQKYPERFTLLLTDKNEGISRNYQRVLEACKGKYVALCEGDDYWTNENKLQLQVGFMERHEEYGFVGTYNTLLYPDGSVEQDSYDYIPDPKTEDDWQLFGNVFEYAKWGPVTRTVSVCFRRSIIEPYIQFVGSGNDMVLQTILAKHSSFAKHKSSMCVYRQGGVSTDRQSVDKRLYYNRWYVQNRLLQKQLFPQDCNWNEAELEDRETFILYKDAIMHCRYKECVKMKRKLRSEKYKNKVLVKHLHGILSMLVLSFYSHIK